MGFAFVASGLAAILTVSSALTASDRGRVQAGGCCSDVFPSISTASRRARGVDRAITASCARTTGGAGARYSF